MELWVDAAELAGPRAIAGVHLDAAERKRALHVARQAVDRGGATFSDYVWLAKVALLAGERDEAEKALGKARQMAGTFTGRRV